MKALTTFIADLFTAEWEAVHPGTRRTTCQVSLWRCLVWFAGESLEWLARRWWVPVLVLSALLLTGARRGRRGVA